MVDNSDRIDDNDIKALRTAYSTLLDSRNAMLDAVSGLPEQSQSRREVIVDSLILGVLHHLHEVANNTELYADRMSTLGVQFGGYAEQLVNEVKLVVIELKPGNPAAAPTAPVPTAAPAERVRPSRA